MSWSVNISNSEWGHKNLSFKTQQNLSFYLTTTSHFTCRGVEDGSFGVVTKLVERFDN